MVVSLKELRPTESGLIKSIGGSGPIRRRLMDMGITPGAKIVMRKVAPLGDPIEINIRGYELSLRKFEAAHVLVETSGHDHGAHHGHHGHHGKHGGSGRGRGRLFGFGWGKNSQEEEKQNSTAAFESD